MIPKHKPQADRKRVMDAAFKEWCKDHAPEDFPNAFLLFGRGYYLDTMGVPGKNDRGIYDDAVFIVSDRVFASFNANTDPSRYKAGLSTILPGFYPYKRGNHGITRPGGGYPAFRPATKGEALPVRRDGESGRSKRDGVANNIHKGGVNGTSSEGCLTIPPSQWPSFYSIVTAEMDRMKLKTIWVGVTEDRI